MPLILGRRRAYPLYHHGEQSHASCCTFGSPIQWAESKLAACCLYHGGRFGFVDVAAMDYSLTRCFTFQPLRRVPTLLAPDSERASPNRSFISSFVKLQKITASPLLLEGYGFIT